MNGHDERGLSETVPATEQEVARRSRQPGEGRVPVQLDILTESRLKTHRRCEQEHHLRYDLGYVPTSEREAQRFGKIAGTGLDAWWACYAPGRNRDHALANAIAAIRACATPDSDPYEIVRAEEMLCGYDARWGNEPFETIAVEHEYRTPLINPETGAASRTFVRAGKLDKIVRHLRRNCKAFVEHKTSGEDISLGSPYWKRLRMDGQVSGYFRSDPELKACIYDVLGKLKIRPLEATPEEKREYTKPKYKKCPECRKKGHSPGPHEMFGWDEVVVECEPDPEGGGRRVMTDPGGKLYANMRDKKETVEEYRLRCREAIISDPDRYYQRGEVVRLDEEMRRHDLNTWQRASLIREERRLGLYPMNTDSCERYGALCPYFGVCSGDEQIDGPGFTRITWVHPELTNPEEERK